ncbi:hypothetical protein QOZ80_7BG0612440 [Eleusine coracana subsp. coracana]|nr:hypothetical protein QOZ80_7BG0612440 [Eleusine coracana subsp. coracana]
MAQAERSQLRVVIFPWLAHGHITPYLELARRLTTKTTTNLDITIHLVSTPVNLASIAHHETDRIRLVELHLPEQPNLPPSLHTTKHLPARLMPALKRACDLAAARFGAILDAIRPDLLLYDFLQPWAPVEARNRGVPAAHFSTCSVAATAFFVHHCLDDLDEDRGAFPFEGVGLGGAEEEAKYTELFMMREDPDALVADRDRLLLSLARSEGFVAVKTCAAMERPYMDYLSSLLSGGGDNNKEMIPCGPLLVDHHHGERDGTDDAEDVTRWLDDQDPGSVVLVSFGTEYFMSESQMAELARGLELSGHRFFWVLRFPKEEDDNDENSHAARSLPRGFDPAQGIVIQGWAPQRRVLGHRACGAFLTHCGWSSVMEAMAAGVPMVALPMHIDQPINANLVAELGAAVRVPQRRRFGEFRAEDVARAVRAVMQGEGEGKEVRRRAAEMREVVKRSDADEDDAQIGRLLQRMARLCGKDQQFNT